MEFQPEIARVDLGSEESSLSQREILKKSVASMLDTLGYDLADENFVRTPERVAIWYENFPARSDEEVLSSLEDVLEPTFECQHRELVAQDNISFVSLCAHHMLPFRGTAAVGYIPNGRVVGLSKLARTVQHCARGLTLQEDVTHLIAEGLNQILQPHGVIVVLRAEHMCMSIRGVEEAHATTTTSAVRGLFKTNNGGCKEEFLRLVATK